VSAPARRPGHAGPRHPLALALTAFVLALAGVLAPAHAPAARAATDGLELATAATYTIVPARHLVHVAVVVTAVNNKPNVTSGGLVTRYFYDSARIAIQTEATNIRATSGGNRLTATTSPADGFRVLEVHFRASLFYQQSARVDVAFDLPAGAPRSKSDIRVGSAFATFVAWAFGDRASVRVVVPAGFEAESTGSAATKSTSGRSTVFRATAITDVGSWYLVVNADRESALTTERLDLTGGEHVVIRAWPEDAAWKKQVSELLARGLPTLVEQTGLAWPVTGDLSIFEVHTPLLEGYAGVFLQGEDKIEISEDLDDLTIIHEASHAWFNSDLFDGRWIDEGLADTYAARTLDSLGNGGWEPGRVSPTDRAAVRLAEWTFPGRITDEATDAREQYGYDASWTVVRSLVIDVGSAAMQRVLAAAQAHQIAYVGAGAPETVTGPNDWRRFLDLLDETGGAHGADEIFRRWVLTDPDAARLDERASARGDYAGLLAASGDWRAPFYVRSPLSDWDFGTARQRIAEAEAILAQRDEIATRATAAGVVPPPDLRTAYEAARTDLTAASGLALRERSDLAAIQTAAEAVAAPRAPLVALGLLGTTPEAGLADARAAFNAGVADAGARAAAVTALIDGAVEIGRGRLVAALIAVVLAGILLIAAIVLIRRRRRIRRERLALAVAAAAGPAADPAGAVGPSYVTLADQSDRPPDAEPIPPGSTATEAPGVAAPENPDPLDPAGQPPADRGDAS